MITHDAEMAKQIREGSMGTTEIVNAVLAAGYRRPRQVTTPEELAALPVGSVVLDRDGDSYQLKGEHWWLAGFGDDFDGHEIALPATVLHEATP